MESERVKHMKYNFVFSTNDKQKETYNKFKVNYLINKEPEARVLKGEMINRIFGLRCSRIFPITILGRKCRVRIKFGI